MGHGFGGTRDMDLESYAARYQEAGFAVLLFDYQHFGGIRGDKYRPVKKAHDVRCPVLLQICANDDFTPMSAALEAEKS